MSRRPRPGDPAGVLLVDKPHGPTSHDVVDFLRWSLQVRQVGHCGTLDPMATGLLIVCVGKAMTRLVPYLTAADKRYQARFTLGRSTDTADAEGTVIDQAPVSEADEERARSALAGLCGDLSLPPPAFSAVRVAGRRAHELARAGLDPGLEPRPMRVESLELCATERDADGAPVLVADLIVAKGTYVRSLALAVAERAGVPVHLSGLRRTACGPAGVDDPAALRGLAAVPHGVAPDGSPRWRIRPGEGGEDREACRAQVRAHLRGPARFLPFPVAELQGEEEQALATRLEQGQRLAGHEPGWAALDGRHPELARARAEGESFGLTHGDTLIVLRVEAGPEGRARIAPERVLRGARAHSEA